MPCFALSLGGSLVFALLALRDLQFRKRRFFVAVVAVGLVFGIALLLSGLAGAFSNESRRVVRGLDADLWVVAEGTTGPFTSGRLIPASAEIELAATPGVDSVRPLLISAEVIGEHNVNLLGLDYGPGGHQPQLSEGRVPQAPAEIVVDASLPDAAVGSRIDLGGRQWSVVGRTSGQRFFAGQPVIFARIDDVRAVQLDGAPVVNAFLVRGDPASLPPGLTALGPTAIVADLDRPLESATGTLGVVRVLLWLVAAGIIGTLVYLTVLERTRDFAVLKATGSSNGALLGGLLLQAAIMALVASVIALALAQVLAPVFPMAVEIPTSAYVALPIVALVIAGLASLAGVRRVLAVDPVLAFGA